MDLTSSRATLAVAARVAILCSPARAARQAVNAPKTTDDHENEAESEMVGRKNGGRWPFEAIVHTWKHKMMTGKKLETVSIKG